MSELEAQQNNSNRNCPQCGAELDSAASDQPCPACLMKLGLASWQSRKGDSLEATRDSNPQRFQPPAPEELSGLVPNLEVLELLGQGGMGAVYKARQASLDRLVALKLIRPDAAEIDGFAERFTREARALAKLNHPNIVTVHDFGKATQEGTAPLYYLVMEFVKGTDLRHLIQQGDLKPEQALAIVPPLCEALQFAHEAGIVHRDIKPENILIDASGRVKIADFGLARLAGSEASAFTLTGTRQIMGTLRYMAPEQMEASHSVDHRADIYSLGVVFYEMLTGQVPAGHFDPPSKKVQIDVRLDEVVLRSLAREPERRYQQASEVKTDVEVISQSTPVLTAPADVPESRATADRRDATEPAGFPWNAFWSEFVVVAVLFGIVGFTLAWTHHGGALAALALPWLFVGGCGAYVRDKPEVAAANANLVVAILGSAVLIAGGVVTESTPVPLTAFGACLAGFLFGTGAGTASREAKKARKAADEYVRAHADETDEESPDAESVGPSELSQSTTRFRWSVFLIEFVILTAIFGLTAFSMHWEQSSTALWMLTVSWMVIAGFGAYHDGTPEHRGAIVNFVFGTLWTVGLLGFGVTLGGLHTMSGIVGSVVGMAIGAGIGRTIRAEGDSDVDGEPSERPAPELASGGSASPALRRNDSGVAGPDLSRAKTPDHPGQARGRVDESIDRGALGQAWDAWWQQRDPWLPKAAQAVLSIAFVVCLIMYLSFQNTSTFETAEDGTEYRHTTITYGTPDPWFQYQAYPEPTKPFTWEINYVSSSMGLMLLGFLLYSMSWQIEKARAPLTGKKLRWLGSPASIATFWWGASLIGVIVAMYQPSLLAGLDDPPPNSPAAIEGDRDPAPDPDIESLESGSIHHAAAAGDTGRIRQLLQQDGVDINQKNPLGMTPLMYAAKQGHVSTTLSLIVLGANINETDNSGQNAMMHASANGHADLLQQLREMENFASTCHRDDATAEQAAERFKQFPGIDRRILDEVTPAALRLDLPEDAQDNHGETALFKAAANGDETTVRVLVDMGASQELQDELGRTALMVALENGHTDFALKRLESQFILHRTQYPAAGLDLKDRHGNTLLALAEKLGHQDIADRIRSWLTGRIAVFTESIEAGGENNYTPATRTYLWRSQMWRALGEDDKADADLAASQDESLREADNVRYLLEAASEGDVERVASLIQHTKVDVNSKDADGQTPLIKAAIAGHSKMVALLLAAQALPDQADSAGRTTLIAAVEAAQTDAVRMLFRVCELIRGQPRSTPWSDELEELVGISLSDTVWKRSTISGPIPFDPDSTDADGETALMKAASKGQAGIVRFLTSPNDDNLTSRNPRVDVALQDRQGRTAFTHAVLGGHTELIQNTCRLDSEFPSVNYAELATFAAPYVLCLRDKNGRTALQLAEEAGHEAIAAAIRAGADAVIRRMTTQIVDNVMQHNTQIPLLRRAECYEALGEVERAARDRRWMAWFQASGDGARVARVLSLFEAARLGSALQVKKMVTTPDVLPNEKDPDGETALMKAAAAGQERTAVVLLLLGANEQERDKLGQTPLMHAAAAGQAAMVQLLLDLEKIHYDEKLQFRITRLDSDLPADTDFAKMRFNFGPELQDKQGETALMKAARGGHTDVVILLTHFMVESRPEVRDKSGRTALMHAVEAGRAEMLATVAKRGFETVAIGGRGEFRYPDRIFYGGYGSGPAGQPVVGDLTVLQYLEQHGMTDAVAALRERIEQMIAVCTKAIEEPEKPEYVPHTLRKRAAFRRELGEMEKADADLARAASLKNGQE